MNNLRDPCLCRVSPNGPVASWFLAVAALMPGEIHSACLSGTLLPPSVHRQGDEKEKKRKCLVREEKYPSCGLENLNWEVNSASVPWQQRDAVFTGHFFCRLMANFSLFASCFLGQNSTFCSSAPRVDVLDIDSVSLINSIFMLSKTIFLLCHSLELVISYVSVQPQLSSLWYLRPDHGLTSAVEFLISWQPGLRVSFPSALVQRGASSPALPQYSLSHRSALQAKTWSWVWRDGSGRGTCHQA